MSNSNILKIGSLLNKFPNNGSKIELSQELKDALVGVWLAYGKSNDSTDRNIIKNKIKDKGGDFVISNAAFKLNSGFGKYSADFESFDWAINISQKQHNKATISLNGRLCNHTAIEIDEMKVNIIGNVTELIYWYIANPDDTTRSEIRLTSGINTLPKSYAKDDGQTYNIGFAYISGDSEITIEQIPSFEGAFVTDGIDDLIKSTKSATEMLDGSNEVTVVSMIHQIKTNDDTTRNNWFFTPVSYLENRVVKDKIGKTGIYGYTSTNVTNAQISDITPILGDKNDYTLYSKIEDGDRDYFTVEGFQNQGIWYVSSIAWYWTIIANKVLTTDQINQVIAYFNLDRTLNPDILCNTIKQGITNENHAEFGDKLIDYSGNGRDIQLNNIAWKRDSGIGKYETELSNTSIWTQSKKTTSSPFSSSYNGLSGWIVFANTELTNSADMPSFKIQVKGLLEGQELIYRYYDSNGQSNVYSMTKDGEYTLPSDVRTAKPQISNTSGFQVVKNEANTITITQIPSHAGGLCLDGINDFGKVTGMPIYKDYTVIADYERFYLEPITGGRASILSKSSKVGDGSFIFNLEDQDGGKACYTFGEANGNISDDITRIIRYQSKYYNTKTLSIGTAEDNDFMVLGKVREVDSRHFCGAIYSLMSFPYSMSEFLIERQLKKHKLGTLYPDMVEFRPVIKANDNYKIFYTAMLPLTGDIWERINIGDYVPVGRRIAIQMSFDNEAKKLVSAVSSQLGNITIVKNSNNIGYTIFGDVLKDKSPQKISITIEYDENYVLFNPVINSNYKYVSLDFYLNNYQKRINIGDYIPKGAYLRANFYLKNNVDELTVFTFNGVNISYRRSSVDDTAFNIGYIYNYDSPQEVNITIDEYIRYEDIVQPYPVLLRFNDENGNEVSWGGKFRVGSTITRIGSAADSNLLPNIYNIFGLLLNDNQVTSSKVIVEKTMVFKAKSAYIFDNNEPKCILSPRLLRIPNSSYKILGHIPDISGHGNHGKINNSAYAGMSGVNGYPVVFGANKTWANESNGYVTSITSNTIHITNVLNAGLALLYSYVKYNGNLQNIKEIPPFKIEIKGLEGRSKFIYKYLATSDATKETNLYLGNGTHELPKSFLPTEALINNAVVGFSISPIEEGVTNFLSDITIKVLPKYEGAYCLDGVDDFVTIPTTVGGKQVLMKVNWDSSNSALLYDQRGYNNEFAIYNGSADSDGNPIPAYQGRNNGQTYIDGILNSNIKASELRAITHNITITNELSAGVNKFSPVIGSNRVHNAYFTNMALYDFMLFDNISTDDKIKELNEYVGTEGNFVEWNPTITTNISSTYAISPNIKKSDGIIVKLVKGNIYSTSITGNLVLDIVPPNKDLDEVTNVIIDGKSYTPIKYQYADYYRVEIPLIFPQEINVIIDEYITYETIEQPYPIFLNYIDKETNKAYTWGDKVKVDSILKISGYKNLFENGDTSLGGSNGYSVNGSSELIALGTLLTSEILVNKINTGVRSSVIWNLNTPKPLFAYDPSIINNVGLKNLGYLPDITGQGRHLLLNEFAYEGMSGINGYPVVLGVNKTWETVSGTANYTSYITSNNIHVTHVERANNGLLYSYVKLNGELTNIKEIPSFKVNIKGLEGNSRVRYYYLATENATSNSVLNLKNGINEISKSFIPTDTLLNNSNNVWIGFSISAISDEVNSFDCDITIEILPNYEGTLCFDGINDYGIVSNLPSQYIKTLLMKVNWMKDTPMLLYDQRGGNYFGILTTQESDINNTKIAYQARNPNGKTYIDGIENNYIETYTLKDITHNITITNSNVNTIVTPVIGSNSGHSANFAQMAMYKVMGLPEIPSDEEIKTLNNWAGIEAKVELPSYYWDAYGKTNLDEDKATIQQRGVAEGDYDITNYNHAYDKMSGYGGYEFAKFDNVLDWYLTPNNNHIDVVSRNGYEITLKNLSTSVDGWYFQNSRVIGFITRDIPFKVKANKSIRVYWDMHSYKISSGEAFGHVVSITTLNPNEDTSISLRHLTEEELVELDTNKDRMYYLLWFDLSTLAVDEEVTIEMLPLYPNGLVYDGVTDYSENSNIPAFTDYTYIFKREFKNLANSATIAKSPDKLHGGAFVADYNGTSQFSFGQQNDNLPIQGISWQTKNSFNGTSINSGTNTDDKGITIGRFSTGYANIVFYKLVLYPKTIPLLQINFLKNLMEKDEIINLNNPIFIQK